MNDTPGCHGALTDPLLSAPALRAPPGNPCDAGCRREAAAACRGAFRSDGPPAGCRAAAPPDAAPHEAAGLSPCLSRPCRESLQPDARPPQRPADAETGCPLGWAGCCVVGQALASWRAGQ